MVKKRVSTKGSEAMENVAEHYANELNAKFRTLNHFVTHAGEIGRAHETFLRGILTRFLPLDLRINSGFVASPNWTSRQQDILIHSSKFSTLFEVGDCIVIDHNSFIGAIEVKTKISSAKQFIEILEIQAQLREQIRQPALFAIYSWNTVSLNRLLDGLWQFVKNNPKKNSNLLPNLIYSNGKFILKNDKNKGRLSSPYNVWYINKNGINEGQALLGLVASVWEFGFNSVLPWWLLSWHNSLGITASRSNEIPWPQDLVRQIK